MAPRLRLAVFALAIASAFAGGYLLKDPPSLSTAAAQPVAKAEVPAPAAERPAPAQAAPVTQTPPLGPAPAYTDPLKPPEPQVPTIVIPPVPAPKAEPTTILMPPVAVSEPPKPEPVDPSDPAFQMIKNQLGIKTSVLDKSVPPPVILADAKRAGDVDVPPPPAPPPEPMTGPVPKLETPRIEIGLPDVPATPSVSKPVPLLNNRAVELDFEVTKAGLSKVTAVELWTTRNGGASWTRTDRMEGSRPPFRTRLGSEGEYGFCMVFESEVGMRTPEPKPGQPADVVVVLDTTPPEVRIFPPTAGPPGTIVLRWLATDAHMDHVPAATRLEYSPDGQTWHPIVRPPTAVHADRYDWTLPPGVPSKVLFRVTTRDKAGNVATAVTSEKMSVDLVAPEGKVTGVRVQGAESEKGPSPREVQATSPAGELALPLLRAALALLLNSPEMWPPPGPHEVNDVSGPELSAQAFHDWWCRQHEAMLESLVPAESAKAWVEQVTNTTVAVDSAKPVSRRPYPDAVPLVPEFTQDRRQASETSFGVFTRGGTVMKVLTDRDWQPSTATPESYRWNGPAVGDRPFGGQFDAVPEFWGTRPVGVRVDF